MSVRTLLALLIALVVTPPLYADDHGAWQFATRPSRVVPFPYVPAAAPSVVKAGVEVYYPVYPAAQFDGAYDGPWPYPVVAPWRYQPDPYCVPPTCLPSYWRPIFPRPFVAPPAGFLPLAAVIGRLKQLDYRAYAVVGLVGANYRIDALNQFDQPVRLIVDAGTGLIRKIIQ